MTDFPQMLLVQPQRRPGESNEAWWARYCDAKEALFGALWGLCVDMEDPDLPFKSDLIILGRRFVPIIRVPRFQLNRGGSLNALALQANGTIRIRLRQPGDRGPWPTSPPLAMFAWWLRATDKLDGRAPIDLLGTDEAGRIILLAQNFRDRVGC